MGILNVTPDSFSDGGRFSTLDSAIEQAGVMVEEGADLIDVGGESTRPGATAVGAAEEAARVVPVIAALAASHRTPISIDTYRSSTAEAALSSGARIVNDVWGLQRDPEIARVAAAHAAPVIVMHNRDTIDERIDIVEDMMRWFDRSIAIAHAAGIPDAAIVLDPGLGFGKSLDQNVQAIARLPELKARGYPVLVGVSRKSMIGRLTGRTDPRDRLFGTLGAGAAAVLLGADILRVHDVGAHVDAVRVADAIKEHVR
ncbi:MAG TPA: dihydropteroate synthase [Methylomirabilota bacterium]|nr:dihydropteroate synthase [Methylomirabilota bacterium]